MTGRIASAERKKFGPKKFFEFKKWNFPGVSQFWHAFCYRESRRTAIFRKRGAFDGV